MAVDAERCKLSESDKTNSTRKQNFELKDKNPFDMF